MWLKHANTLECPMAEKIRHATHMDDQLNVLTAYMINGWPSTRAELKEEIQLYWPFCDDTVEMMV